MHLIITIALSIAGGWLVNLAADALPNREPLGGAMGNQFQALRCMLSRSNDRQCDELRPKRTLTVYAGSLLFGALAFVRYGFNIDALIISVYAWYLLAITVIDFEHRKVLNRMLIWALPVVAVIVIFVGVPSFESALYGAAIGLGVFMLATLIKPGGMGMGDVKLAGLIGLATGIGGVAIALVVGVISGGIAGFVLLLKSKDRKATMAYAPYLALGAWVSLYFGAEIVSFYLA